MAAPDFALTWGGFPKLWPERNELEALRAELQALKLAVRAKDAEIQQLQRRLEEVLEEAERGRARESSLRRRAEIAEAAEEALASQIAEVEAEAYVRITRVSRSGGEEGMGQMEEAERRVGAALERAAWWEQRCRVFEAEVEGSRARAAALLDRAEVAEEALGAVKAELQRKIADASKRYVGAAQPEKSEQLLVEKRRSKTVDAAWTGGQVAEWRRHLKEAQQARDPADAEKNVPAGTGEAFESVSLGELAGMVNLRLWSPSSLKLSSQTAR